MQKFAVLFFAATLTTFAEGPPSRWSVKAITELHGIYFLQPDCGSLQHFLGSTQERHDLGTVNNRRIIQLLEKNEIDVVKRLLVERAKNEFCLLYFQKNQPSVVHAQSAEVQKIAGEPVLMTRDREDGTGAYYLETYWAFDEEGPIQLDIGIIQQELAKLLPPDHGIAKGYGLNLKALCYRMPVWKKGDANCCPTGGAVALKLAIENHRLAIVSKKFDANGSVEPRNSSCEP